MGLAKRIIPCLDVHAGRVVKGVNFVELRDAGDPVEIARRYDEQGADELAFLDITASSDARDTIVDVIERVADQVFIPLTVGGGVRQVEDVRKLLNAGADKVSINTAAVEDPDLVRASRARASARRHRGGDRRARRAAPGRWEVFTHGGRKARGLDVVEWAAQMAALGAGEILLTSMDRDGTKSGFDLELTRAVTRGGRRAGDRQRRRRHARAPGRGHRAAAAPTRCWRPSIFHFGEITVPQAKRFLAARGIEMRL